MKQAALAFELLGFVLAGFFIGGVFNERFGGGSHWPQALGVLLGFILWGLFLWKNLK